MADRSVGNPANRIVGEPTNTERDIQATTFTWGIILGLIALLGVILLAVFFMWNAGMLSGGMQINSENTATRPAEP